MLYSLETVLTDLDHQKNIFLLDLIEFFLLY